MSITPASLPGPSEAVRRSELRTMKLRATAMLVVAAVVFIAIRVFAGEDGDKGVLGYVQAAAEAAMVGGLADWFAVTALFKHPLGLPIPHTAIVPKRKDEIGRGLGEFVKENFLDPAVLSNRLDEIDMASKLGDWMGEPRVAHQLSGQLVSVLGGITEVLNDEEAQATLERILRDRIEDYPVAPLAGRMLTAAVEGGHHETIFDSSIKGTAKLVHENQDLLRRRLGEESPWWVPDTLDDRVFDRVYEAIHNFINEVAGNPNHELRDQFHEKSVEWAAKLQDSPELIERGEELKTELMDHPEFNNLTAQLWEGLKESVGSAANDPDSDLRQRLEGVVATFGERLQTDPELRTKVNRWLESAVGQIAERSGPELADFIADTVTRWDSEETADRIELQVGRDLQFIRINGTVVGGLAGLVIHAIGDILG